MVDEIRPISSVLLTKYYSGDQIRKNEMKGHVAPMAARRDAHRILVGRLGGKSPLGRPICRWGILKWILKKWNRRHGLD
jgi:hypothetical protein